MTSDSEQQVRLQFLDEARDYIDQIESGLLGVSDRGADRSTWDGILRAAHSIKGGAAMMDYLTLSHLAHRLEDNFKVIKTNPAEHLDNALEQLLLTGVDHLRQVSNHYRDGKVLDEGWLSQTVHPTFDQLLDRLGEPTAEDSTSLLSEEMGEDIALILFESEVEDTLTRLEGVLVDPAQSCVKEEFTIAVQELAGLGDMLDLPAFASLCRSIETHLNSVIQVASIQSIAQQAILALRQAQGMVLIDQRSLIPTQLILNTPIEEAQTNEPEFGLDLDFEPVLEPEFELDLPVVALDTDTIVQEYGTLLFSEELNFLDSLAVEPSIASSEPESIGFEGFDLEGIELQDLSDFAIQEEFSAADLDLSGFSEQTLPALDQESTNPQPVEEIPPISGDLTNPDFDVFELPSLDVDALDLDAFNLDDDTLADSFAALELEPLPEPSPTSVAQHPDLSQTISHSADVHQTTVSTHTSHHNHHHKPKTPVQTSEAEDQTLRVSLRQLNQLNELFGELIIERNGLSLYLKRIRELIVLLTQRVQTLEQSNTQLRSAYDKVATASLPSTGNETAATTPLSPMPVIAQSPGADFAEAFDLLEMDRYSELHSFSQELMETAVQIQEVTDDLNTRLQDAEQTSRELTRTTKQLQVGMTQLRMRPLADVVSRYPRMLRDWALQYNKEVELKISGTSTLIDRTILDALSDPLLHILRNAYDHGIENSQRRIATGKSPKGQIEISAAYRGNQTLITVRDDGGGIPLDKVKAKALKLGLDAETLDAASESQLLDLIFEPGFSTASTVTELSGRGVGMDIVRTNLQKVGGTISVATQAGKGTTFLISVPYTLSVIRVLLVESGNLTYAVPTDAVEEMRLLKPEELIEENGQAVLPWEDLNVPVIPLSQWLRSHRPINFIESESTPTISEPTVLMMGLEEQAFALQVERYWGEQEVTIRQVEGDIPLPLGFAGCTILGDGRVVPLVDPYALLSQMATQVTAKAANTTPALTLPETPATVVVATNQPTIMVVDDSVNVRRFMALTLTKAGFRVEQAKDGQDALDKLNLNLPVQAIVCDVEMPRLDGFGFLAHAKADPHKKQIPVVMLTSRSGDKHRKLAMSLGASAYFSKPFREPDLLTTLDQLIQTSPQKTLV